MTFRLTNMWRRWLEERVTTCTSPCSMDERQNEWVRGVTTPSPPTHGDSWRLKSLFYPIWWHLPYLLTHPRHHALCFSPAADLMNANWSSIQSSLQTLLAFQQNQLHLLCSSCLFSWQIPPKHWNVMFAIKWQVLDRAAFGGLARGVTLNMNDVSLWRLSLCCHCTQHSGTEDAKSCTQCKEI